MNIENNKPDQNYSDLSIESQVIRERLRQASLSFNLAFTTTVISFGISLIGAGLLLCDRVPEGTIASAMGLVSSVRYLKLAKYTNDCLDRILNELDEND